MIRITVQDKDGQCQRRQFRDERKARRWLSDQGDNESLRLAMVTHADGALAIYRRVQGGGWRQMTNPAQLIDAPPPAHALTEAARQMRLF